MSGAHGHGHDGGHGGSENKRIALLISVLALILALSETLGKSAQTTAIDWRARPVGCAGAAVDVMRPLSHGDAIARPQPRQE